MAERSAIRVTRVVVALKLKVKDRKVMTSYESKRIDSAVDDNEVEAD